MPDFTTEVRDVALAMMIHTRGGKVHEFGFLPDVRNNKGEPVLDPFTVYRIGFHSDSDREAAHKKAREWLEKQEKARKEKDEPEAAKLVEQLGAGEFAAREVAEKQLKELGLSAKPAVLAGLRSESPEIVRRCQGLFSYIRGEEVKVAFLKAAGDDDAARTLLAEVLKDAHRAKVLDESVQHPEGSGKLYAAEQWRLWQKAVSTPPRQGSGHPDRSRNRSLVPARFAPVFGQCPQDRAAAGRPADQRGPPSRRVGFAV